MIHALPEHAAGPGHEPGLAALLRAPASRPLPAGWWYDPRTLVVADADTAVHALCADEETGTRSEPFLRPPGPDGEQDSASLPGRDARLSWTQPAFTAAAVRAQAPALLSAADACLDRTPPLADGWDVLPTVQETTAHLAAVLCLGPDAELVRGLDAPLRAATPAVVRGAGQPRADDAHDRFEQAAADIDDRLRAALRRRRATPTTAGHDLLSVLLAGHAAEDEALLTVLFTRLFSAQTAPGFLTAWLLHLLATHPAEQRRLREEALAVLGPIGTPPTIDPAHLTATQRALREALRLYPPSWLLGRTIRHPTRLGGHDITPGSEVRVVTYLIHRDPAYHPNPYAFTPDRWAAPRPAPHRGAYLPFGIGDRFCRGAPWVTAIAALTTASLLRRQHLNPTPGSHVTPHFGAHLEPAGLHLDTRPATPA